MAGGKGRSGGRRPGAGRKPHPDGPRKRDATVRGPYVRHDGPSAVYRLYDAAGGLLYVGITMRGFARMTEHHKAADWFPLVERATFEHYPSRFAAAVRETEVIATENPTHNIVRPEFLLISAIQQRESANDA